MTDNDVMQVAMSGHLLMEPKMDHNENRRVTDNDSSDTNQSPVLYDDGSRELPGRGDPTSSLEHYFDQQFHNFPMARLSQVDWSLRSDGPTFDAPPEVRRLYKQKRQRQTD